MFLKAKSRPPFSVGPLIKLYFDRLTNLYTITACLLFNELQSIRFPPTLRVSFRFVEWEGGREVLCVCEKRRLIKSEQLIDGTHHTTNV